MKLAELFEMAKTSKAKRKNAAKRARKDKAATPTLDVKTNLAAKFAQTSGAGAHQEKGKHSKGKRQRREGKRLSRDY
jgi:hypothetical protein